MSAQVLAEAVLAVHLAWIVWLIAGLPVGLWLGWRALRLAHAASLAGQLGMQLVSAFCPLTAVEEWLRGGGFSYGGSWLAAWLERLIYVPVSPQLIMALTLCWVVATLVSFIVRPLRR